LPGVERTAISSDARWWTLLCSYSTIFFILVLF
jgi:hypothetical protein